MTDSSIPGGSSPEKLPGLHWSLKRSFVDYIHRMPDGQTGVSEGAISVDTYDVVYPILQGGQRMVAQDTEERFWEFGGDLRFKGHFGMLFVRIASPVVFISGGRGQMSIADPFAREGDRRRVLIDLALEKQLESDGLEVWHSTDARLHADSAEVFNEVYSIGESFEPLKIIAPTFTGT